MWKQIIIQVPVDQFKDMWNWYKQSKSSRSCSHCSQHAVNKPQPSCPARFDRYPDALVESSQQLGGCWEHSRYTVLSKDELMAVDVLSEQNKEQWSYHAVLKFRKDSLTFEKTCWYSEISGKEEEGVKSIDKVKNVRIYGKVLSVQMNEWNEE